MVSFARAILISIIAVISLIFFLNLAFFVPWYLTMVETGFALSQMIATDNYLRKEYYDNTLRELQGRPIFRERVGSIEIEAEHVNEGRTAIEAGLGGRLPADYYEQADKPYVQMGEPVRVTVSAAYPLQMKLFGQNIHTLIPNLPDIEVSFSMNTTATRHYKDLYYDYTGAPDPSSWVDDLAYDADWYLIIE